jgi:hypothetical protein
MSDEQRHHAACLCGCQFVSGLVGNVVERFDVPYKPSGATREQLVAYSSLDLADPSTAETGGL